MYKEKRRADIIPPWGVPEVTRTRSEVESDFWPLLSHPGKNLNNVLPTKGKPPGNIISPLIYGMKFICEAREREPVLNILSPPSHIRGPDICIICDSVCSNVCKPQIFRGHDFELRGIPKRAGFAFLQEKRLGKRCKFILIYERFPSQHLTIHNKL